MANRGALFNQKGCPMLYWTKEKLHAKIQGLQWRRQKSDSWGEGGICFAYNPPIWQNS